MMKEYMNFNVMLFLVFFTWLFTMSDNLLLKFFLMEFSNMIVIMYMNLSLKNKIPSVLYFMMSVLPSFFILIVLMQDFNGNSTLHRMLEVSLYFKSGLFPFHIWNLYVYDNSDWIHLLMINIFNKFMLVEFFHASVEFTSFSACFLAISTIMISLISYKMNSLKMMISCSTANQTSLMIYMISFSESMFFQYFFLYMIITYIMFYYFSKMNIDSKMDLLYLIEKKTLFLISFTTYICLPPLSSFALKGMFMYNLIFNGMDFLHASFLLMMLMIGNILMIWNYFSLLTMPFTEFYKMSFTTLVYIKIKFSVYLFIFYMAVSLVVICLF